MVAFFEEIKEIDSEQTVSGAMYVDGDLYGESIDEDEWEVEVYDQSSATSRSVTVLDRTLETNVEIDYQIDEEVDNGVVEANNMILERSEVAEKSIKEIIREYGNGSDVGVENSYEIDSASWTI